MDTNRSALAGSADGRHFQGIASDKPMLLRCWDCEYEGTVIDISLRGLVVRVSGDWLPSAGERVHVHVPLDNELAFIDMYAEVIHFDHDHIGLRCVEMDAPSAGRLRRMVELDLADPALLERDLEQLLAGR